MFQNTKFRVKTNQRAHAIRKKTLDFSQGFYDFHILITAEQTQWEKYKLP